MILLMFESAMDKSLNSYFACSKLPLILIFPKNDSVTKKVDNILSLRSLTLKMFHRGIKLIFYSRFVQFYKVFGCACKTDRFVIDIFFFSG